MRPPHCPPKMALPTDAESFIRMMSAVDSPVVEGKYLHWDDLLHRTPPAGLTREEWWQAIKFRRSGDGKLLALRDKAGRPFTLKMTDAMIEKLHLIDMDAGGHLVASNENLNERDRDLYIFRSLIEESIASSQIEGAVTTREVAKEMLQTGRAPRDSSEKMILNNYKTILRIREIKDEKLTPDLLCELHRLMTEDTLDDPAYSGRYRAGDVHVSDADQRVFFFPPSAEELPARVEDMCRFANSEDGGGYLHPAIRSIVLHFWLAHDHPFVDGNGRTARALFYWSMLRHKYWLFEFVSISRLIYRSSSKYYRAFLLTESDDNDLNYFIVYHLNLIDQALAELHQYIDRRAADLRRVSELVRQDIGLNHRQRELLAHALKKSNAVFTIEGHKNTSQTAYATARQDLLDLAGLGYFVMRKAGKKMEFYPAQDLRQKLKAQAN